MAGSMARGLGYGQKEGISKEKMGIQIQLFTRFADHGGVWIFIKLDMPTAGQPETGVFVVNQQEMLVGWIEQGKIGDQVLGWGGRFSCAK